MSPVRPAHEGEEGGSGGRKQGQGLQEVRGDALGGKVEEERYIPRLKELYRREVVPLLMERFGYKNIMQVPRLEKIVLNAGVGEATQNPSSLDGAMADLAAITGQKPAVRRARKSISNFKLRKGMAIGCKVTLRGDRMYEFLDRMITFALPRVRDFQGLSTRSFDGRGNYTLGIREQIVFPEIDYDKIDKVRGFNVTIVTTARTDEEAYVLLKALGMPFRE
ncbi:MAG: 50S ribosomal protein L5 [Candidatus Latescibacterota bacterium]|nr:MAG: 50S ribosomal protein L5 [Candidatus Latescibacterota bacterium]RKY66151.1 MAG: 50S ribosomal protein L5 [Candidatus Latescibacterota bacterium]